MMPNEKPSLVERPCWCGADVNHDTGCTDALDTALRALREIAAKPILSNPSARLAAAEKVIEAARETVRMVDTNDLPPIVVAELRPALAEYDALKEEA